MEDHSNIKKQCSSCQAESEFLGQIPVRTHGATGATQFFFGEIAELYEGKMPIDIFRCTKCGHLDMFDLDFSLPNLSSHKVIKKIS